MIQSKREAESAKLNGRRIAMAQGGQELGNKNSKARGVLRREQGEARFAPCANEMVQWTISRAERAEHKRRARHRLLQLDYSAARPSSRRSPLSQVHWTCSHASY